MRKPCCDKGGNRGAWTKQEDQKLIDYIGIHGEGCWRSLSKAAGLHRCGRSCRLRWMNYLRPDLKRGNFAHDEEELIIKLHALLGNRWSLIAGRLPGRTDNEVKNYWNSHLKKKLLHMGIDPNNHKVNQIPSPQQPKNVATVVVSMNDEDACKSKAPSGDNNDKMSDAGSCLEDETSASASSSNLNLDLTIAVPSPPLTLVDEEKPNNETNEFTTLLLFG